MCDPVGPEVRRDLRPRFTKKRPPKDASEGVAPPVDFEILRLAALFCRVLDCVGLTGLSPRRAGAARLAFFETWGFSLRQASPNSHHFFPRARPTLHALIVSEWSQERFAVSPMGTKNKIADCA